VDETTMRAEGELPACPACDGVARPNVLMFGDVGWLAERAEAQLDRYRAWLERVGDARLVILECGAGTSVPTVRLESERVARRTGATLVRINVREPQVPAGPHVGLPLGAAAALAAIDRLSGGDAPV
jgi:NAD-dependent SIR2 family protein deacetylase